ncbi:MAG: HAMP domain-containing sensor histidine kinase [Ahrensia sp.]
MANASETEFSAWVNAGLADFVVFDKDGTVAQIVASHLKGIEVGANIFTCLPVLSGFEDIFTDPTMATQPTRLEGVVAVNQAGGLPLDFSIGLSRDSQSGLLLVTPNFTNTGGDADRLRNRRKQAYLDDLLAQERARFEEIYRQSPVLAFALGSDGTVIAVSDQLHAWLADDADVNAWIKAFCRTHRSYWHGSARAFGETVSFRTAVSPQSTNISIVDASVFSLESLDGDLETYVTMQDVTVATAVMATLSRQHVELAQAADALQTSNRRLEQFAHVAAHDLLGPLGRMSSFSDIIELELGTKAQGIIATAVDAIRVSARESIDLVQDLLTLAKLQHFQPEFEEIEIKAAVNDLKQGLLRDLEMQFEFSGVPTLDADRRLLDLILRNALGNSYKYRHHDRPLVIKLAIERSEESVDSLTIADNGSGFDDHGDDPFGAFSRMREHSSAQGTGLGLAMVKDAAETMGWQAGISSSRGHGTTLLFNNIRQATD